ncbi:MAG: hypothetical protein ACM35H_07315 [Bacteroidota bacterium]
MTKALNKAVIVLGFARSDGAATGDGAAVRRAVREALSAGLKELIFVTADSLTPVEAQVGDIGPGKPERVVVARQFTAANLGEALCGVRHLLDEEPFVLLLPAEMDGVLEDGMTSRLVAAYRESSGNIVALNDETVLQREGSFAAIAANPAGRYLLQPSVLDALEDNLEAGLAGALLTVAEAWPVTALAPRPRAARLQPLVPPSERPTVRAPRPVALLAAQTNGGRAGNPGL